MSLPEPFFMNSKFKMKIGSWVEEGFPLQIKAAPFSADGPTAQLTPLSHQRSRKYLRRRKKYQSQPDSVHPGQHHKTHMTPMIRTSHLKQKPPQPLGRFSYLLLILLVVFAGGCAPKSYFVQLDDQEAIAPGTSVSLDGKVVGEVTEIIRQDEQKSRMAKFVITDPDTEIREGTQREVRGSMQLSSASCVQNALILKSGSTLQTRSSIANFAKVAGRGARDFFYKLIALHPATAIAAVILAVLLGCFLFAACRRVLIALIVILIAPVVFLCAGSSGSAQTIITPAAQLGVLFTRDFLRQEQSLVARHIRAASENNDAAERLLDGRLVRDASEELVCGLFRLDSADLLLQGQPDQIALLKSAALSYARAEEQRKLTDTYTSLYQQLQAAQERTTMLRRRCAATNEQDSILLQVPDDYLTVFIPVGGTRNELHGLRLFSLQYQVLSVEQNPGWLSRG